MIHKLETIDTHPIVRRRGYRTWIHEAARGRLVVQKGPAQGRPLAARVNHGRWLVDCPDCSGAELLSDTGEFYCLSCGNIGVGGAFRTVLVPRGAQRAKIEALLEVRPTINRNWEPDETVAFLVAENEERKLPGREVIGGLHDS